MGTEDSQKATYGQEKIKFVLNEYFNNRALSPDELVTRAKKHMNKLGFTGPRESAIHRNLIADCMKFIESGHNPSEAFSWQAVIEKIRDTPRYGTKEWVSYLKERGIEYHPRAKHATVIAAKSEAKSSALMKPVNLTELRKRSASPQLIKLTMDSKEEVPKPLLEWLNRGKALFTDFNEIWELVIARIPDKDEGFKLACEAKIIKTHRWNV
jgi:hypothetical protein